MIGIMQPLPCSNYRTAVCLLSLQHLSLKKQPLGILFS
jgi:hypothetical protein